MSDVDEKTLDAIRKIIDENRGDPLAINQKVCDSLRDSFSHYSWAGIYLVEGDNLILKGWSGEGETEHTKIKIGEGICGLAAETGKTVVVPDVSKDFRYIMCFATTKSEIVVPIIKDGTVVGEIDIDSDKIDAFDKEDEVLLEKIAEALANAY